MSNMRLFTDFQVLCGKSAFLKGIDCDQNKCSGLKADIQRKHSKSVTDTSQKIIVPQEGGLVPGWESAFWGVGGPLSHIGT